jgi:hypothetical protein
MDAVDAVDILVSRKRKHQRGRITDDEVVDARLWAEQCLLVRGETDMTKRFRAVEVGAAERLCYRPEEADREVPPWGSFVFILRKVPTKPSPKPGCGYWAKPYTASGYDRRGRYSVNVTLPCGTVVRLWPYEYTVLSRKDIDGGLRREELVWRPFAGTSVAFHEMPEFADLVGALMLDGMTLEQAVYELHTAGVEDAKGVELPASGWFEAMFELPWI